MPLDILLVFLKESANLSKNEEQETIKSPPQRIELQSPQLEKDIKSYNEFDIMSNSQTNRQMIQSNDLISSQICSFNNDSKDHIGIKKQRSTNQKRFNSSQRRGTSKIRVMKLYIGEEEDLKNDQSTESKQYIQDSLETEESIEDEKKETFHLQNLVPFSIEVSIIKEAFLQLEQILIYTKSTENKQQQESFLQISNGIVIFKGIKNYCAVQSLYQRLADIHFNQNNYDLAIECFQSSLNYGLLDIGIESEDMFWELFSKGSLLIGNEKLFVVCLRYYMIAFCYFQLVIECILSNNTINYPLAQPNDQQNLQNSLKYIKKCLKIQDRMEQYIHLTQKTLQINYINILAAKLFVLLNDRKNLNIYIKKINQFQANIQSPNITNENNLNGNPLTGVNNQKLVINYGEQQLRFIITLDHLLRKNFDECIETINNIFENSTCIYSQLFINLFHILKYSTQYVKDIHKSVENDEKKLFTQWDHNFIFVIQIEGGYPYSEIIKKIDLIEEIYEKYIQSSDEITLIIYSERQFEVIQHRQTIKDQKHFYVLVNLIYEKYITLKNNRENLEFDFINNEKQVVTEQSELLYQFFYQSLLSIKVTDQQIKTKQNKCISQNKMQNILIFDRLSNTSFSEKEFQYLKNSTLFQNFKQSLQVIILSQSCEQIKELKLSYHTIFNLCTLDNDILDDKLQNMKNPCKNNVIICQLKQIIPLLINFKINKLSQQNIEINYVFN